MCYYPKDIYSRVIKHYSNLRILLGCCNGSKKTGKGYIWHYLDNDGNVITSGKGRERTIMVRNEDIV